MTVNYDDTGHAWEKMNIITRIDKHGHYDLWRCKMCGQEYRRRGVLWNYQGKKCKHEK